EGQRLLDPGDLGVDQQRVVDLRHLVAGELDVEHRADDAGDAARGAASGGGVGLFDSCSHVLSHSPAESASAFAPPTISLISCVMPAWRAWLAIRVYFSMRSCALSVADFMAFWRAASSDA